jgi:SNF2 family DNA or RNA helicase
MRRAWRRKDGHWLLEGPFSAVVADEIHEVRMVKSDRAQALTIACTAASGALGLSGTPVNRDMEELRNILQALAVPKLEREKLPLAYVHQATKASSVMEATKVCLFYHLTEMQPAAIQEYNKQLYEAEDALSANAPMARVRRSLQRLELVAVHPALLDRSMASRQYSANDTLRITEEGSPHLQMVLSAIQKATEGGNKLIVVTAPQTHILRATADFLSSRSPHTQYWYTGAVSEQQRESSRAAFVAEEGQALLFLSQKAGGQALSLVPAAVLIFAGIWFTHTSHDQTIGRLCRPGQTRKVQVFYVGARQGLTEAILRAQEEDRARTQAILGGEGSELLPAAACRIVGGCCRVLPHA